MLRQGRGQGQGQRWSRAKEREGGDQRGKLLVGGRAAVPAGWLAGPKPAHAAAAPPRLLPAAPQPGLVQPGCYRACAAQLTHLKRMVAERPAELEMRANTRPSSEACMSRLVSTCAADGGRRAGSGMAEGQVQRWEGQAAGPAK